MVHIQWKDRYNINFMDIDDQHRSLLELLNQLIDLVGDHADPEQVSAIFSRLCQYALTHFANEESYLAAVNYPGLDSQRHEHGVFIQKLLDLDHAYDPTDPHLLEETISFLKHWYLSHILNSDMKYQPFLKAHHPEVSPKAVPEAAPEAASKPVPEALEP